MLRAYTLIITAPDDTETRNNPVIHGAALALAVAETLRRVTPGITQREARAAGLKITRTDLGVTRLHAESGYRFRIEEAAAPVPAVSAT